MECFHFNIQVTDSSSPPLTASPSFSLTVNPPSGTPVEVQVVSANASANNGNGNSDTPAMDNSGTVVAFESSATNLTSSPTTHQNIFLAITCPPNTLVVCQPPILVSGALGSTSQEDNGDNFMIASSQHRRADARLLIRRHQSHAVWRQLPSVLPLHHLRRPTG